MAQVSIIVFDRSGWTCPKYLKLEVGNIFVISKKKNIDEVYSKLGLFLQCLQKEMNDKVNFFPCR